MSAGIAAMGIVSPVGVGVAAHDGLLEPRKDFRVGSFGEETIKEKRLPRLDRMALAAAKQALAGHSTDGLALVYATGYGNLDQTAVFLDGMATRGFAYASPAAFHQSVHHAPAGQISIALGIRGICLTTSAREISGEMALKMGLDLLDAGRADRVLVIAADEVTPALTAAHRAFGVLAADDAAIAPGKPGVRLGEGAAAILLTREPRPVKVEAVLTAHHPTSSLRFPKEDLRRLFEPIGPTTIASSFACGTDADTAELAALKPSPTRRDCLYLGLNPSGGLLRTVLAAMALARETRAGATALVHDLALGGGQAAVVLRHAA